MHVFLRLLIGRLSNDDSTERQRKRHPKIYLYFICATSRYFNSLKFYKNGELSRNQIGRSGVQFKKENEKFTVVRSRSPQNLECGHFTLLFCRGRQRHVPKCKTDVQSDYFCSLRTVPTFVTAHTFCASQDTRISYGWCLLIQGYFCAV